jgi:LacI family transcriptional regulator
MRLAGGAKVPDQPTRIAPRDVVSRRSTDALAIKDRLIARTLRTIRERMGELEDVEDLIDAIGVPRRTLEVRFRKVTGQTLAGELANARVSRARELLSSTDLSVKEIAYLVGFSEPRMLTLVFKRVTGELPSDYRQRVRPGG